MMLTFCTYLKPDDHEWKNKKGLINFLLFDFKWERTQKDVEKLTLEKDEGNQLRAGTLPTLTSYQCCSCRSQILTILEAL